MIAPNRRGRSKAAGSYGDDGRWKVERLFAWLMRFRRVVTRWESKAEYFLGFVQLAARVPRYPLEAAMRCALRAHVAAKG